MRIVPLLISLSLVANANHLDSACAQSSDPVKISEHKYWGAYRGVSNGTSACFALSYADVFRSNGEDLPPAGRFTISISSRPAERVVDEFSISFAGMQVMTGSDTAMQIDGSESFDLYTDATGAWIKNAVVEDRLIQALIDGSQVSLNNFIIRGVPRVEVSWYLSGLLDAINAAHKACGMPRSYPRTLSEVFAPPTQVEAKPNNDLDSIPGRRKFSVEQVVRVAPASAQDIPIGQTPVGMILNVIFGVAMIGGIAWAVKKLVIRGPRKPYRDLRGIKTVNDAPPQNADKRQKREAERQRQLAKLRVAVPSAPPERMRATIQLNEYKKARVEQRRIPRLIGEDEFAYVEVGEDYKSSVDMILEMSETERAIIKEYELDDVVLEDTPLYSKDQLLEAEIRFSEKVRATKDIALSKIEEQVNAMALEGMRAERNIIRIGDLLVAPFSREFDSMHEAKQYADKLKKQHLPRVRELLDQYRDHKQSETIEF